MIQIIDEEHEEDEETSAHLLQSFGSTMNTNTHDEIQQATEKNDLSPRGQKERNKKNKHAFNNNSAITVIAKSSINTRSKS